MGVHDFLSLVETFPMLGWLIECSDLYSLKYSDCEFVCLSNRWAWSNPGEQADEQGGVIQRRTEKGRRSVVDKRAFEADSLAFYSQEIQKALERWMNDVPVRVSRHLLHQSTWLHQTIAASVIKSLG